MYTPQLQKKAVLSHISVLQLEIICEIAYNIQNNKNLDVKEDTKHEIKKKNKLISALANKKLNSNEKAGLIQKKTSEKVGENSKIEQEADKVLEGKEEGKVGEENNKKREEGSIEQGVEKQPHNSQIKHKIELRKRKHTIYGNGRAVVNLPSPGVQERPVYRTLGRVDFFNHNPQNTEGKAEQLLIAGNESLKKVSVGGG